MVSVPYACFEGALTNIPGLKADGDQSANQFKFMTASNPGKFLLNTSAGAPCLGVLQDKPIDKQAGTVAFLGVSKVLVGAGGLTAGCNVASDGSGLAVIAGDEIFFMGIALHDAAEDELCSVLLGVTGYTPAGA